MSRFSPFVDGLEWLNDTMRLNGAFWMAIDNISKRSYSCAIAVWCVCKNTRVIWEIPASNRIFLSTDCHQLFTFKGRPMPGRQCKLVYKIRKRENFVNSQIVNQYLTSKISRRQAIKLGGQQAHYFDHRPFACLRKLRRQPARRW